MEINSSLSYVFKDDDWATKLGLGALFMIIPGINFACVGYEARVIRNLAQGEPRPLPTWNDFSVLFMDGLQLGLARLTYSLPSLTVLCCSLTLIVPFMATVKTDHQFNQRFPFIFLWCGGLFIILIFYSLIIGFILPALTIQYVRWGTFAACFNFGAIVQLISHNLADYLTVWAVTLGVNLVLTSIASMAGAFIGFLPGIGQLAYFPMLGSAAFLTLLISGHLQGQLIRADEARAATH